MKGNSQKDEAYWIKPNGEIVEIPTGSKHILEVIKYPELFGYTLDEIKKLYTKYNESLGVEGEARRVIILDLVKQGWIRIRKYYRPDHWSITLSDFSSYTKQKLKDWAEEMIKKGHSRFDEICIDLPEGKQIFSLKDLLMEK